MKQFDIFFGKTHNPEYDDYKYLGHLSDRDIEGLLDKIEEYHRDL